VRLKHSRAKEPKRVGGRRRAGQKGLGFKLQNEPNSGRDSSKGDGPKWHKGVKF
jgi:hypothetical protein